MLQVALDGAHTHGNHHEQNREKDLGDQALPVSAAVVEPLDHDGCRLLPYQGHAAHHGWTGELCNTMVRRF